MAGYLWWRSIGLLVPGRVSSFGARAMPLHHGNVQGLPGRGDVSIDEEYKGILAVPQRYETGSRNSLV